MSALERFQGPRGVVFWPREEIALIRDEWEGRLEVTHADGTVAHRMGRAGDLRGSPFQVMPDGALLHPGHARAEGDRLLVPGGWQLPLVPLEPGEPLPPLDPDEILALVHLGGSEREWVTRAGRRPCHVSLAEALASHPELVKAGRHHLLPSAVRGVTREDSKARILLEGGVAVEAELRVLDELADALGVADLITLEELPEPHGHLRELRLRDWPKELLEATREELDAWFGGDLILLVDHLVWQTYRLRSRGGALGYGRTHRGLFYQPVLPVAARAGHLESGLPTLELEGLGLLSRAGDPIEACLLERLDLFVSVFRLFTFRQLGFTDRGDAYRRLGEARADLVLVAEKASLDFEARVLARMFGLTLIVLGGVPKWISAEFLAEMLLKAGVSFVRLVSYCDFDPYGWGFPGVLRRQLERYGVGSDARIWRLVLPSRFSERELDRLAVPLSTKGGSAERVREWLLESGGVRGLPLGLYADSLRPLERLVAAFREETGLEPVLTLEEATRRVLEEDA